jgi:hypothetical protein
VIKINPFKLIISPARIGWNILLIRGEMISLNGPRFLQQKKERKRGPGVRGCTMKGGLDGEEK